MFSNFFQENHSAKHHAMFTRKQAFDTMGNIILADSSNDRIRQISACGFVTTIAGTGVASSTDGLALASTFNTPIAVAVDSSNNIYVADSLGFRIRRISGGIVTTLVGASTGWFDAAGAAAKLAAPRGMAFDTSSNLYIADAVRVIIFVITIIQYKTDTIVIVV
jgi:serine/threonine-protein kinase